MTALIVAALVAGSWQYDGFWFEGHRYPNPNPSLVLTFTFDEGGTSHLYWHRIGEPGFCERKAEYEIRGDLLYQKVTWLNPKNAMDCGRDPDMQLGKETLVKFTFNENELHFYFELNGKEFIYILKNLPAQTSSYFRVRPNEHISLQSPSRG